MTETFNRYGIYEVDHKTFGGEITPFDFDGHHTMSTMAKKIYSDYQFDKQCKKNEKTREMNKKWRSKNDQSKL